MAKRHFWKKMNNRGSALLVVVLVVGFLTILATTLLYITGMDFQTKQADYQNKKNFYTGETALEELKANLMEDASIAAVEAYNEVTMKYITLSTKETRRLEYNTAFVTKLQEQLIPAAGGVDDWNVILGNRFTPVVYDPDDPSVILATYKLELDGDPPYTTAAVVESHEAEGYIRVKGLTMICIDPTTQLASVISTDLDICAPEIDWSATGALQTLEDGVTGEMAARSRTTVDAAKCVRYANWKKE